MSEIRELLSAAQQAEIRGEHAEAVRLLRQAAAFYRDRGFATRAMQMLRHARRLEGVEDEELDFRPRAVPPGDELGFGDSLIEGAPRWEIDDEDDEPEIARPQKDRAMFEQRGPALADPNLDAWCSFCCRPKAEVGALIAGPAGAFICAACLRTSAALIGAPVEIAERPVERPRPPLSFELPAQRRARERLEQRQPRMALVLGPEGAGKSALLRSMGAATQPPFERLSGDTLRVDLTHPLAAEDEAKLLRWLDEHPKRRVILSARGVVPKPVLVLQGEHGEEPVFDTAALGDSVKHLSREALSRVDAVVPLEAPDRAALGELARGLLSARGVTLPDAAVEQLVSLAEQSGRGAHELAALIARIPPGSYAPR